jgi:hypothetical protein
MKAFFHTYLLLSLTTVRKHSRSPHRQQAGPLCPAGAFLSWGGVSVFFTGRYDGRSSTAALGDTAVGTHSLKPSAPKSSSAQDLMRYCNWRPATRGCGRNRGRRAAVCR